MSPLWAHGAGGDHVITSEGPKEEQRPVELPSASSSGVVTLTLRPSHVGSDCWAITFAVPLLLLLLAIEIVLHGDQGFECEQVQESKNNRHFVVIEGYGRAYGSGVPDAGRGGGAADVQAVLNDGSSPDEADAGDQALKNAGTGSQIVSACDRVDDHQIGTRGHGYDGERADSDRVTFLLKQPSGGQ